MLTSLALLACVFSAIAQDANDPAAKKILEDISKNINSYNTLKIVFSLKLETYNGKLKIEHQKKGTLWLKKSKYKLEFEKQTIYCDGNNVWSFDKSTNEVQITKPDEKSSITPQKLLTDFYNKDFLYKLNPKVKLGKDVFSEIELTPIDKSKPFFKAYIYVSDSAGMLNIKQIKVFERNGTRYTYNLHRLVKNKKLEDDFFIFKPDPNSKAEIIDLR